MPSIALIAVQKWTERKMEMGKQICKDCPHLKSRQAGIITTIYWCGLVGDGRKGTSIGCHPWIEKPHPKCPLRDMRKEDEGK